MPQQDTVLIRNALIDNYNAYAQGLDSRDWDLVRGCFDDEVLIEYGELSAPTGAAGVPRKADDWLKHLQLVINSFDITRHTITNHRVQINNDEISCRAYLIADHVRFPDKNVPHASPDDVVTVVGEYTNFYRELQGRWKIYRSELVVNWTAGNLALFSPPQ